MGIFDEAANYGGTWVRRFNQAEHYFIENNLLEVPLLYDGACAGFSVNWLEFKHQNPEENYPENYLELPEQAHKIIEVQKYARYKDESLSEILTKFGHKKIETEKIDIDNHANLFSPGVKVISFKKGDYENDGELQNHVAVVFCRYTENGLLFELFDAARGDVRFLINRQNMENEKNPVSWLGKYFSTYKDNGFFPEVTYLDDSSAKYDDNIYNTIESANDIHETRCDNPIKIQDEEAITNKNSNPTSIKSSINHIFFNPYVKENTQSSAKPENNIPPPRKK